MDIKSMDIVFVGVDLAKNVFAVHGVDEHGKPVLVRPSVPRAKLAVMSQGWTCTGSA
jgi:transposase